MILTSKQMKRCLSTISPKAFYPIVLSALSNRESLSVVRVADGEKILLDNCKDANGEFTPITQLDDFWLQRYGVKGITKEELYRRIIKAGTDCTYFAPSISGVLMPDYALWDYFPERGVYIDNFFVNDWTYDMKTALFKEAGHILLIHGNVNLADSMQLRAQANLGVKVSYISLTNWSESEEVIKKASRNTAPLVVFSGGPASKYISNEIATTGCVPKVVLDLGAAAQHWTFQHLPADRDKAVAFHKDWSSKNTTTV